MRPSGNDTFSGAGHLKTPMSALNVFSQTVVHRLCCIKYRRLLGAGGGKTSNRQQAAALRVHARAATTRLPHAWLGKPCPCTTQLASKMHAMVKLPVLWAKVAPGPTLASHTFYPFCT